MRWRGALGAAVIGTGLVVCLAGCSGGDAQSEFPDSGVYASTQDSTFALVEGTSVKMELVEGRMSVSAGCNTLNGTYSVSDSVLAVPALASTRIGCPDDLALQDQRLTTLLTSSPMVAQTPAGFTLTTDDGTTLVMAKSASSPGAS